MKSQKACPPTFTQIIFQILPGALTLGVALPAALLVGMRFTHWMTPALIYHGVMNYLLTLMLAGMFGLALSLSGSRIGLSWRWMAGAAGAASLAAISGIDQEYLLAAASPALVWAGLMSFRKGSRALRMALLLFTLSLGVTAIHHVVFLGGITNPWTEQREGRDAYHALGAGAGVDKPDGCTIGGTRYELCASFEDRFVDKFSDREDFAAVEDALRGRQELLGGSVAQSFHDKNDDVPVWAFAFDGDRWTVLMSHDSFYRERIVPAMAGLWWWSVLVWGSLGAAIVSWHETRGPQQRRQELDEVFLWAGAASIGTGLVVFSMGMVFGFLDFAGTVTPGDWSLMHLEAFLLRLKLLGMMIPVIWMGIGAAVWLAHGAMMRPGRP